MSTITKNGAVSNDIACSDERDLGAFIPSELDDFGLDPYQFRVYCRLARRAGSGGNCWESVNNIAKACKMNRKTVMQSIAALLSFGMLRQEKRAGKSDLYKLTSSKFWNQSVKVTSPPDGLVTDEIPVRVTDTTSPPDGLHQSATGTTPVRLTDTKVLQEVTPTSYSQELVGEEPPNVAPLAGASSASGLEEITDQEIDSQLEAAKYGACPSLRALNRALSIDRHRTAVISLVRYRGEEFGLVMVNGRVELAE